jgi:hypothetical protein
MQKREPRRAPPKVPIQERAAMMTKKRPTTLQDSLLGNMAMIAAMAKQELPRNIPQKTSEVYMYMGKNFRGTYKIIKPPSTAQ